MATLFRIALTTLFIIGLQFASVSHAASLTIGTPFGPNAEVPDPRAGYNGWMSNQSGVTETLMGIDYDMNLYPRVAESIDQAAPTTWNVTLRAGVKFHDGTPVTAQSVVDAIAAISEEDNVGHNARIAKLLDLASVSADGDRVVVFETNSPNAAFPWTLSEPGIAVLGAASDEYPINATGPYIFREAIPEQLYRAEANADFRLGEPGLDEVIWSSTILKLTLNAFKAPVPWVFQHPPLACIFTPPTQLADLCPIRSFAALYPWQLIDKALFRLRSQVLVVFQQAPSIQMEKVGQQI